MAEGYQSVQGIRLTSVLAASFLLPATLNCVVSVFPNVRTARKISNTLQKKTPKLL